MTTHLGKARHLVSMIEASGTEADRTRRLPDDLIESIRACGLFDLYVPATLGGPELDPIGALEVIETIARADGSAGWVTMILNGSLLLAWMDHRAAKELVAPGDFVLAGMFGPLGRAVPDGDGYVVSGRWPFNSGSVHATWMLGGVFVTDGDRPRLRPDGHPDWRFAIFPASGCEIHDTWHASGLRATSSHDISVDGLLVPAERLISPMFDPPTHDGPHSRMTFFALLSTLIAAVPLGIARRAIDEAVELARTKARGVGPTLLENSNVQLDLLWCEADLRAARALVVEAINDAWSTATAGAPISMDQRVALRLAARQASRAGIDVVDRCFAIGGGEALYDTSPLQRCWRDLHAASHHIFFSDQHAFEYGGVHFGLQDDSIYL